MAVIGNDYALQIGLELNTGSIAQVESQIRAALSKSMPGLEVVVNADQALAAFRNVTTNAKEMSAAIAASMSQSSSSIESVGVAASNSSKMQVEGAKAATAAINEYDASVKELQLGLERVALQQSGALVRAREVASAQSQAAREAASVQKQTAKEVAAYQKDLDAQQIQMSRDVAAAQVQASREAAIAAKQAFAQEAQAAREAAAAQVQAAREAAMQGTFSQYAQQIDSAAAAQSRLNVFQNAFLKNSAATTHLLSSIGNIATWTIGGGLLIGGGMMVGKGFTDAIHSQQEQVVQGFYYQGAGKKFTPQMSNETMAAAIHFAREYGITAIQAQEAIGLWAKDTQGKLLPALNLANDALKLNAVSGMNMEEIFRSTTAVLAQYHLSLAKTNELYNVGLLMATKYGGGIKMIGGESQDAVRQMLEGIDSSAAVLASFGLTLNQAAAANAVVIGTANKEGMASGGGISKALDALEKGTPQKAMAALGIQLHNNKNLFKQLFADWNKDVPGMKNTLDNILTAHASPYALEWLKVLTGQIPTYYAALKSIRDMEKKVSADRPLDSMFGQIKHTDQFKMQQFTAGMDAASIVIARQFLPELKSALNFVNNSFVPGLIDNAPAIAMFAKDLLLVGEILGGWEIFKLGAGLISSFAGSFTNASTKIKAAFGGMTVAEQANSMEVSAQQRSMLSMMSTSGEVTTEMESQIKVLAATTGASIEDMILAYGRLKGLIVDDATTIDAAQVDIEATSESLAAKLGLTAAQGEAAFADLSTAGVGAAAKIEAAFSMLIPTIGTVIMGILGIQALKGGIDGMISGANKSMVMADKYDPKQRAVDIRTLTAQGYAALARVKKDELGIAHGGEQSMSVPNARTGHVSSVFISPAQLISDAEANTKAAHRAFALAHDVKTGQYGLGAGASAILDAEGRKTQLALQKQLTFGGPNKETGQVATSLPKSKTAATDFGNAAALTHSIASGYMNEVAQRSQVVSMIGSEIDRLKTLISIKGNSLALTDRLIGADNREAAAYQAKAVAMEREQSAFLSGADVARKNASKYAVGTKEHNSWLNQAATDSFRAQELGNSIANLGIDTMKAKDAASQASAAYHDFLAKTGFASDKTTWKSATENFKTGAGGVGGLETASAIVTKNIESFINTLKRGDPMIQEMQQYLKEMGSTITEDTAKVQDFITATDSAATHGIRANTLQLNTAGLESWVRTYDRAIASIDDKWSSFERHFKTMQENAQGNGKLLGQLQSAQALEYQWIQTSKAVALYNEKVSEAKASISYSVITAGMNTVGNAVSSYLTNPSYLNDPNNNQIAALDSQLGQMNYTRSMIDTGPYAKYHRMQSLQIQQQEKVIEQEIQHLKQIEAHPPLVKKVFQDMEKALVDGFIKKFEQSFQNQIIKQFIGEQKTVQTPQITATTQNTAAIRQLTSVISHGGGGASGGSSSYGGSFGGGGGSVGSSIGSIFGGGGGSSTGSAGIGAIVGGALGAFGGGSGSISGAASGGSVGASGSSSWGNISNWGTMSGLSAGASQLTNSFGGSLMGAGGAAGGPVTAPMTGNALAGISNSSTSVYGNHNEFTPGGYAPSGSSGAAAGLAKGHTLAGGMQALGGIAMASQGYQQGGLKGSVMSGIGAYESVVGIGTMLGASNGFAAALAGPIGIAAAAIMFGLSLFHPHYSPSTNPDMYANDGYAQGVANAMGFAYTQANGSVYEDSGLKQQLGGMTELQYLTSWYNQYPGGTGLNSDALTLWNEIGTLTGNGKGVEIAGLHQGNIFIADGSGNQVGESGNWQNVLTDVDTYTQDLYTLLSANQSLNTPMISMNAYGGSGQNPGFNLWSTPGLSQSEMGAIASAPYGAMAASLGVPSGAGIGSTPTSGMGGYPNAPGTASVSIGDQQMQFVNQLNVDGAVLAQIVNAYNNQRQTAGYTRGT